MANKTLEEEFKEVVDQHLNEINEQLEIASKALKKAEQIAELHGIPFCADISPLSQSFTPASFKDKFGDLDSDIVSSITGAYDRYNFEYGGWEHSAVC